MNRIIITAVLLSGCGLTTHGYSARYSTPVYQGRSGEMSEESYAGTEIAVPVSPMNPWGCDPSFQLEIRNRSENHDAAVNIHRLVSDGTTLVTAVNIPRGGARIICLPDVGEYELEVQLFAMNLGAPRIVGCYSDRRTFSTFVGVLGRHEHNISDFRARGSHC